MRAPAWEDFITKNCFQKLLFAEQSKNFIFVCLPLQIISTLFLQNTGLEEGLQFSLLGSLLPSPVPRCEHNCACCYKTMLETYQFQSGKLSAVFFWHFLHNSLVSFLLKFSLYRKKVKSILRLEIQEIYFSPKQTAFTFWSICKAISRQGPQ